MSNSPSNTQLDEMKQAVLTYGSSAFSFDIFEVPESYFWFSFRGEHGIGGIAYKQAYGIRVIMGDPLLPKEDWAHAISAFVATRKPWQSTLATFASLEFAQVALQTDGAAIEAQTAVNLNPQTWQAVGAKTARIRQYARKAEKQGLSVERLKDVSQPTAGFRKAADDLVNDWKQNSLKRAAFVHEANLWRACERKQYFALREPNTDRFQALVVARPLATRSGFYLWTARRSTCPTGALEATIAEAIRLMREDGVRELTFGPFQAARPHLYMNGIGGTRLSRWILKEKVAASVERRGYHHTMNFFKKFDFQDSENIYNLVWPKQSWIRPYLALHKLFS